MNDIAENPEKIEAKKDRKPSENAAKLRAVTLAIARTRVRFGRHGAIDMYRDMAINVLDGTKGANDVEDIWSKDYDELLERLADEEKKRRGYR